MADELTGKVALVTGASSGIGKAIALRFARAGASVAVNYVTGAGAAQEVVEEIAKLSRRAQAVHGDVSQIPQIDAMVQEVLNNFGRIDILINNAGIQIQRPFLEVTEEEWTKMLSVDLKGSFFVAQRVAQVMVRQGVGGRIINISSVHEKIPRPLFAPYCAAKGGVRMLTRSIAIELAPYKITVNGIGPGAIATPINREVLADPEKTQQVISEIPLGRFGEPEEVAELALYLASDAAAYVTGATFFINGGLMHQVVEY